MQKPDIDFDAWCDPDNPKTVTIKDVCKAATFISPEIPKTPLTVSEVLYCTYNMSGFRNTRICTTSSSLHVQQNVTQTDNSASEHNE